MVSTCNEVCAALAPLFYFGTATGIDERCSGPLLRNVMDQP